MRISRALSLSVAALLAGTASTAAPVPAGAGTAPAKASSDIALKAGAYGTRLVGGDLPAGSGMTAFSVIGCSTKPGARNGNVVADADLPQLGTASAVKTKVWTERSGSSLHSFSRSSTAEVVLADSPMGSLSIRGVTSLSHAWHDSRGFHSDTRSSIGRVVFTPAVGDPQDIDIPTPGNPVRVPGLAVLKVGEKHERSSKAGASAWAVALRVKVLPTGTDLFVARSKAEALAGVKHGKFGGYSAGTEADVLGGVLTSGRNPLSVMPCQSTGGQVQSRSDADLDLGGGIHVEGVNSKQWSKRFAQQSKAWERGSVAGVNLGDGALVIDAVVGKATVTRKQNGGLVRSAAGTRIGSITVNGERQELPLDRTLEIPGVAKLRPKVVQKVPGGLQVIALRITLLDGSGAVLNLGSAKTTIRR